MTPALQRQRQVTLWEFEASLVTSELQDPVYTERPCLTNKYINKIRTDSIALRTFLLRNYGSKKGQE